MEEMQRKKKEGGLGEVKVGWDSQTKIAAFGIYRF
jgi:hypothetical protein